MKTTKPNKALNWLNHPWFRHTTHAMTLLLSFPYMVAEYIFLGRHEMTANGRMRVETSDDGVSYFVKHPSLTERLWSWCTQKLS